VGLHEVEIAIRVRAEIGNQALVDAVGADDDAALRGLPEHFGQAHYWHQPNKRYSPRKMNQSVLLGCST
jgi:hypothetical protein